MTFYLHVAAVCFVLGGDCGSSRVDVSQPGNVTSPNFPANYPNGVNCRWTFVADVFYRVELRFHVFDVEQCGSCICDSVRVRTHTRTLMYSYIYTHDALVHTRTRTDTCTYTYVLVHTHTRTLTYSCIHVLVQTRTRTYTYA